MKKTWLVIFSLFAMLGISQLSMADAQKGNGASNSNRQSVEGSTRGQDRADMRRNEHAKGHDDEDEGKDKKSKKQKKDKKEKKHKKEYKEKDQDRDRDHEKNDEDGKEKEKQKSE